MDQLNFFDGPTEPPTDTEVTLRQAIEYLQKHLEEGLHCPCCTRWAQKYRLPIGLTMARALIRIHNAYESGKFTWGDWIHVEKFFNNDKSHTHGKLRYWGLLERQANDDPKKKHSGIYRITQKGIDFVKGRIALPSHCWYFDDQVLGYDGDPRFIWECFKTKFDYEKLMRGEL